MFIHICSQINKFKFKFIFLFVFIFTYSYSILIYQPLSLFINDNHEHFRLNLLSFPYKYINISYSTDSNWHLYTIVSISSLMEHSTNKSLWYNIYILTCPCFSKTAKQRIQSLSNKYSRLSIIFLSINRKFANYHPFKSSCSSILRLFLPDLLPNVQKIIHLDVDTYIFKDLDEMFYLNMTNLHFRGILDNDYYKEMEKFGFSDDHYINSGVLLMNLDEMRKDHFIESAADFLKKNGTSIYLVDQLLINIVSFNKCSLLPLTFGFHNWYCTEKLYKKFFKKPHFFKYYSYEEVHRIIYNLTIVHFMKKPWNYGMRPPYNRDWALTALKTDFINEISSSCRWIKLFLFL